MDHLDHVPDLVKQFCHYFYRHIRERNIPEIQSMYEVSFLKLSERYYKTSSWPAVELIQDVVDQDHVFCLLYKELYFRHLYARCQPDLRQRCESWDNYCDLFGLLLHSNVNMQLPNCWLWDMVDEFVYQFQSFSQYRAKVGARGGEEGALLAQCDKVWAVGEVLNVLQALVDKSGIVAELEAEGGAARFAAVEGYYPNTSNVLRMLGYFSLVGLVRVHALVGDYHAGLKAMYPLNVNEPTRHLFTPKIVGAHITLCYYAGFCYMMMRRYLDAARVFNGVLAYINRVKQYHARSVQYDQILKKNEQMYALLACVCALCPVASKSLDENVATQLRERNAEKMARMARGELGAYDELFSYACPKFVTPTTEVVAASAGTGGSSAGQAAYRAQLAAFLSEVKACSTLPTLKQYLLLYSSIEIGRLAALMEEEEGVLRTQLTCLKAKAWQKKWVGGADATTGVYQSASDIDFYIDVDPASGREMVIVSDSVHQRQHADLLARHIGQLEGIIRDLEATAGGAVAPAAVAAPAPKAQAAF